MEGPFYRELNKSLRSRNREELKAVFFPALKRLLHALNKLPRLSMTVCAGPVLLCSECNFIKLHQVYRGVKKPLGKKYTEQMAVDPEIFWSVVMLSMHET
jgi:hypothetical protein